MSKVFRRADISDIEQLKQIWADGFGDSKQDIDLFFKHPFKSADIFVCADGARILAAIYSLNCILNLNSATYTAGYLYALTSKAECRKLGIMTALIEYAKCELDKPLWLYPADEKLRQFYQKRGFASFFSLSEREFIKSKETIFKAEKISAEQAFRLRHRMISAQSLPSIEFSTEQLDYAALFYDAEWLKIGENAIALAYLDGEQAIAIELLSENEQITADAVCDFFGVDRLSARVLYDKQLGENMAPMIWLPDGESPDIIYANFELN